jgi:hypothetical protein
MKQWAGNGAPTGLDHEGKRNKGVEAMADSLEELAPATQSSLAHGKRQELVTVILPEMLRRELAHKGHPTLSQWPGVSWLGSNFSETGGKGHPLCRSIDSKSCIFPSPSLQHRTKIRTALGDNSAPRFLEMVPLCPPPIHRTGARD